MIPPRRTAKPRESFSPGTGDDRRAGLGRHQVNEGAMMVDSSEKEGPKIWMRLRSTWKRFSPPLHTWGFVPASISSVPVKLVERHGEEGVHYALGYAGLVAMTSEYGEDHSPSITIDGVEYGGSDGRQWGDRAPEAAPANRNPHERQPEPQENESLDQDDGAPNDDAFNNAGEDGVPEDAVIGDDGTAGAFHDDNGSNATVSFETPDAAAVPTPSPTARNNAAAAPFPYWDGRISTLEAYWEVRKASERPLGRIGALERKVFGHVREDRSTVERLEALEAGPVEA